MSPDLRAPLIGKMQCWLGMINWLAMGTRPDLSTALSFLASHTSSPSPGHLDAVKHLGRYIKSTAELGLVFSSRRNIVLLCAYARMSQDVTFLFLCDFCHAWRFKPL